MQLCPYYSTMLAALDFKESPGTKTMSCTKTFVVCYDPEILKTWDKDELAGGLIHEVSHLFRNHHERGVNLPVTDFELWNRACDYIINKEIQTQVKLPQGSIAPPYGETLDWNDFSTPEEIYLQERANGNEPDSKDESEGSESQDGESEDSQDENGNAQNSQDGDSQDSGCGSCVDGDTSSDPEGGTDNGEMIIQETASEILEMEQSQPGTVPKDALRQAQLIKSPKVNYLGIIRQVLGGVKIRKYGNYDYTYTIPNRRHSGGEIIFPAHTAPPEVSVICLCDTSGSIDEATLSHMVTQVSRIARLNGVHMKVGFTDAQANVELYDPARYEIKGGGGTDMITPLISLAGKADLIFLFTDGGFVVPREIPQELTKQKIYTFLLGKYINDKLPTWLNPYRI